MDKQQTFFIIAMLVVAVTSFSGGYITGILYTGERLRKTYPEVWNFRGCSWTVPDCMNIGDIRLLDGGRIDIFKGYPEGWETIKSK